MKKLRKIIHIDMDYFFAQVEELKQPRLKTIPFAIGSRSGRGVISTSNYIARKYGVKSALPVRTALKLCPHLELVSSSFGDYKQKSREVFEILNDYGGVVQPLSLDEAYIDVTQFCLSRENESAYHLATQIRARILDKTGLTASAGISYNKFLAKYACEVEKPNGQFMITPSVDKSYIQKIHVRHINGVGRVMEKRLAEKEIFFLGDILNFEKYQMQDYFGSFGPLLYDYARGIDNRAVKQNSFRKSLSVERTFSKDLSDLTEITNALNDLFEEFLSRLQKYSSYASSASFVKIKYSDFTVTTIEKHGLDLKREAFIYLFKKRFRNKTRPIRLLGLGVKFEDPRNAQQLEFACL